MKKLTPHECAMLTIVHMAISHLIETTKNKTFAERLNKIFDDLPASEPDGLKWPDAAQSSTHRMN